MLKYLFICNIIYCSVLIAQTSRDEVIQITSPTDGEILLESQIIVTFDVATFFQIDEQQCDYCDGHLKVFLDQDSIGVITSANQTSYTISGLSAGTHFLEIEAVQPYGESFDPMVNDTVSFIYGNVEGCPPELLTVFGGDEENILSWTEPTGGSGCGDFVVTGLPFSDTGTNLGMGDEWPVSSGTSQGEDVAYTFNVSQTVTITVDMCSELTDYDCKLEIFTNDNDCLNPISTGNYDDDGPFNSCPESPATYTPSLLENVTLSPGQYYIVVDGYGGATGNYGINITTSGRNNYSLIENTIKTEWPLEEVKMAEQGLTEEEIESITEQVMESYRNPPQSSSRDIPEECGIFITYRIYDSETNSIIDETTDLNWSHGPLVNGTEHCYYVTALYEQGETVISSNVACGIPQSFTASPPTNVSATPLDEEVLVYWTDPTVTQLGIPYLETFHQDSGLIDLWLIDGDNWVVSSFYGNPIPAMQFSYNPTVEDYEQSLFSPVIPIGNQTSVEVSFDIFLSDYINGEQDDEYLSAEYFTGTGWAEIETWRADTSFDWTTYTDTIDNLTNSLQVRFRAHGVNSFDINYWLVDNFRANGVTRNEYDFAGYNVYYGTDENNLQLFNTDIVLSETDVYVTGLTNGVEYTFGVASVHEGEPFYYSDTITSTATPIWLYGDISGVITDPNGATLDSVIVSSGDESDTTGTDGTFTLWNLDVGTNSVTARRSGFSTSNEDVAVLAQEDPTVQNLVLSPDMKVPHQLTAKALDEQVYLEWRTPTYGSSLVSLQGTWSIVGDWNCDGGSDFTVDFTFNDDGTFSYPDNYGQPTYGGTWGVESGTVELSAGNYGTCDAVTFDFTAWVIFDYYLTTYYITHDGEQGFGVMDSEGDGSKDGDLLATRVSESTNQFTIDALHYDENSLEILGEAPDDISELSWVTIHDLLNREEELIEYRVYEVAADELDTLVATVVTDTFATVTASPNYLEHCYNVKAFWYTGDPSDGGYGQLESIASNLACTIPYKFGDADFDNDVDITDVLAVVDFILEEDVPTEDQIRNCDVNSDEEINIADVVMMVDIIFGGTGRIVGVDAGEIAYIDLKTDFKKSLLTFEIEYNGPVRGIEFELKFDPTMVNVMPPSLLNFQENVMISYTEKEPGILKVLAADLQGGHIEATDNSYMSIPVEFMGNERENSFVTLDGIKLAGADGSLINTVSRTNSSEVKVIPGAFALHQNFPNPFNPSTEIRFDLPEAGNVSLAIYNLMGQKIRTLSSDNMTPGYHAIIWDGTNDIGSQVATGMYFYSIQSNEFQATKKMLFLK